MTMVLDDLYGPDVSVFDDVFPSQRKWDWTYIRRSIGLQLDSKSDAHMAAARALGIPRVGWYHYISAGIDAIAQAEFFMAYSAGADFLVSDCEGATSDVTADMFNVCVDARWPIIEYVQGSRRKGNRGPVSGQIIAAWELPALAEGALGWQAWSADSGLIAPAWVPRPADGDWDVLQDAVELDKIIAEHKGNPPMPTSEAFNLVPLRCLRKVLLPATDAKPIILYRQDRTTPYTTLRSPVSLGYIMAADAVWAVVADGDAGCYVHRADMGPITSESVTVGN
jgi:hypothetical protein